MLANTVDSAVSTRVNNGDESSRVASADTAVHTRVYHGLTGPLPGISLRIAGEMRREEKCCTQRGEAVRSVTLHARALHSVPNVTKQQHQRHATFWF